MIRLPFLEDTTPPPFYQPQLSDEERIRLDRWFIGLRSQRYYLDRFADFDRVGRLHARWNWAAFFSTFGWLLYRKRYLDCLVYCVAGWSFIKMNIVILLAISEFLFIKSLPPDLQMPIRIGIGAMVWLFWSSMVARWADAYYYRMARREIADAVAMYSDAQDQKAHLTTHGTTSLVGLSVAFGLFGVLLAIIVMQFMPIVALHKEQETIFKSHQALRASAERVAWIYDKTGRCPVDLPVSADSQNVQLVVVEQVAGVATDCAVVATITKATYPVRYLNGRTLTMYRTTKDDKTFWRCQSSLNKKQTPRGCH